MRKSGHAHLWRRSVCLCVLRRDAKVCELDVALFRDQEVGALYIPVDHALRNVKQAAQESTGRLNRNYLLVQEIQTL